MPGVEDLIEENMVCATVNAPHKAASDTILAYLAAHMPERALVFRISFPSRDVEVRCKEVLVAAGIIISGQDGPQLTGTAAARIWTRLLITNGVFLETYGVLLSPARPGQG